MKSMVKAAAGALAMAVSCGAQAQQVKIEEFKLDNGMTFLLCPRTEQPNNIAAGWLAKVGSANERPGITGISHFFEHMMFKGTETIGTKDAKKDAEYTAKEKALRDRMNTLIWGEQYRRARAGEIDDPWDAKNDTTELAKVRAELKATMDEQLKTTTVKNEFDSVYTSAGGSGMNAFTSYDLTFFFINVPSNKFELWAWMESDRLGDSVFREFYSERDVVHEERRLRTESTPTGVFQEQFDGMFWQSSPYGWPVIGWPSDLNSYTREEADKYFNIYYRPNNLVGVIVGDFNPAEIKPVIESYFGRLKKGEVDPPPVVTTEMPQNVEKRMYAECDCQPQVQIRYHTVPFNHADSFALEMMANVLNGQTGRLYKNMVEGKKIASSANAQGNSLGGPAKYAGYFEFSAETKGDATPEQLEQAWYEELGKLQNEEVGEHELQKVKNQAAANAYRQLGNNFFLMVQIGYFEAMGGWEYINDSPKKMQLVTSADIKRVANQYFAKTNRTVGIYTRKAGAATSDEDPDIAALPAEMRTQAKMMVKGLMQLGPDKLDQLRQGLAQAEANASQVPPDQTAMFQFLVKKLKSKIAELEAMGGGEKPADGDTNSKPGDGG